MKPKLKFRVVRANELFSFKSQRFPVRAVADYMGRKVTVVIGLRPLLESRFESGELGNMAGFEWDTPVGGI